MLMRLEERKRQGSFLLWLVRSVNRERLSLMEQDMCSTAHVLRTYEKRSLLEASRVGSGGENHSSAIKCL